MITSTLVVATNVPQPKTGIAGGTITAGELLIGPTTALAAAKSDTLADIGVVGVALTGGAVGQLINYAGNQGDVVTIGATVAHGETYCASANAGKIAPITDKTTGEYIFVLGFTTPGSTTTITLTMQSYGNQTHY